MTSTHTYHIRFIVGSRRLFGVARQVIPVVWTLEDLIEQPTSTVPACGEADGYQLSSPPAAAVGEILSQHPGWLIGARSDFARHYICLDGGFENYLAQFSSKTRSTLRRKSRKFADADGGTLDVRSYRTPAELAEFMRLVRPLNESTYQTRLLGVGLPTDEEAEREAIELARQDALRAFLLFLHDQPVAYLYLPARDETLLYLYLGYSPEHAHLSPGTVLQLAALEQLFAEGRFRYFDFTEGDGAHKAKFGTHSIDCSSFVLLRPSLPNRLLLGSLAAFDAGVAAARMLVAKVGGNSMARRLLRG
jgi:CelD/BcsL family acetyltransferase involved in cellulose biosynthesis